MSSVKSTGEVDPRSCSTFPLLDEKTTIMASETANHSARKPAGYTHRPQFLLLVWLIVSVPLVAWDTLYVHLRPLTMPGGRLHSPIWTPYALYGSVDFIYGWPAWNAHNGFTAAQSAMNIPESAFYCWYLYVIARQVTNWTLEGIGKLEARGEDVKLAVLLCFSGAVMTVSKSVLYWLNEAFSDFGNIGHNTLYDLIVIWIIPNGAWIVVPSYMIYVLGKEILESMNECREQEAAATPAL